MKKIETIWREMLFQALEKGSRRFVQKDLAAKFNFSTSTIFQALKTPRAMGAVRVTGRDFILEDPEKLLYHWASVRRFENDILLAGRVELQVIEIEGLVPPETVLGGYTAAKQYLEVAPADYDQVYFYADPEKIKERYQLVKGRPNLFVLKADKFLADYGGATTLVQTFVDLWNLPDWYAKEFTRALKGKIDGLLP